MGIHSRNDSSIRCRVFRFQMAADRSKFRTGFLEADPVAQPAERHISPGASLLQFRRVEERHPDVLLFRKVETIGHDADDCGRRSVDLNSQADDIAALAEAVFPKAVS